MISWLTRWWGNETHEQLAAAENELRRAVSKNTQEAQRAVMTAEIETNRTKMLINSVEQAIKTIKRGESNGAG